MSRLVRPVAAIRAISRSRLVSAASGSLAGGSRSSFATRWLVPSAMARIFVEPIARASEPASAGPNLVACGLAGIGAVLLIIRLLTLPRGTGGLVGVSGSYGYGPSFGAFAGVGLAVVQAIIALLNVRTSGEKLPALSTARSAPASPAQAPPSPQAWNAAQAQPAARPTWDAAQAQPPSAWETVQRRDATQRQNTFPGQDTVHGREAARQGRGEYGQQASHGQPGGYGLAPQRAGSERPATNQELAQRLSRLDDLRARGLISDAEHADQRRRIISQL